MVVYIKVIKCHGDLCTCILEPVRKNGYNLSFTDYIFYCSSVAKINSQGLRPGTILW
jgi:hypothetical protein